MSLLISLIVQSRSQASLTFNRLLVGLFNLGSFRASNFCHVLSWVVGVLVLPRTWLGLSSYLINEIASESSYQRREWWIPDVEVRTTECLASFLVHPPSSSTLFRAPSLSSMFHHLGRNSLFEACCRSVNSAASFSWVLDLLHLL